MKTWKALFVDTIKKFFVKPSLLISWILFLIFLMIVIFIIPTFIFFKNSDNIFAAYYAANSFCYILAIFVSFIGMLAVMAFDISDATFILTRPVKRSSYFSSKIAALLIFLFAFSLITSSFWLLANAVAFPNTFGAQTMFIYGFTKTAIFVPYILSTLLVVSLTATFKWYGKSWLIPTSLLLFTMLSTIPYILYEQFQAKGIGVFQVAIKNVTLWIPICIFTIPGMVTCVFSVLTTKYIRVRV